MGDFSQLLLLCVCIVVCAAIGYANRRKYHLADYAAGCGAEGDSVGAYAHITDDSHLGNTLNSTWHR